jgi:pimeloyl-ACP methyl ester carboxylesterase
MGGAVAQLLWRRHPEKVGGLVLCATSSVFAESDRERRTFTAMGAMSLAARVTPAVARRAVAAWILDRRQDGPVVEWVSEELQRNVWTQVLAAGAAHGRYDSRPWLGEVDVPAAVVLTRFDRVVSPRRQAAMARAIPRCPVFEVDGDHGVVAMHPERFVPALLGALGTVVGRGEAGGRPARRGRRRTGGLDSCWLTLRTSAGACGRPTRHRRR